MRVESLGHLIVLIKISFLYSKHCGQQRTANSRCHQQLGPHTTNTTTRLPNITLTTNIITRLHQGLYTTGHRGQLSSDHLPIITTINIRHDYRLQQNRQTFTNYKKADWTQFTEDTEFAFAQSTIPTNIHTANRSLQSYQRERCIETAGSYTTT